MSGSAFRGYAAVSREEAVTEAAAPPERPVSPLKIEDVNSLVVVVEIKYVLQVRASVNEFKTNSGRRLTAACYSPMHYHTQLSQ